MERSRIPSTSDVLSRDFVYLTRRGKTLSDTDC